MDWVISCEAEPTGQSLETRYTTEASFLAALQDMFSDIRIRVVSATLSDGRMLDEDAARELVGAPHGSSWE